MDEELFAQAQQPMNLSPVTDQIGHAIVVLMIIVLVAAVFMAACRYYQLRIAR